MDSEAFLSFLDGWKERLIFLKILWVQTPLNLFQDIHAVLVVCRDLTRGVHFVGLTEDN